MLRMWLIDRLTASTWSGVVAHSTPVQLLVANGTPSQTGRSATIRSGGNVSTAWPLASVVAWETTMKDGLAGSRMGGGPGSSTDSGPVWRDASAAVTTTPETGLPVLDVVP